MKKNYLLITLMAIAVMGYAQKIHSNNEILKIMSDSPLSYEVKALEKPVACKDYSDKLNYNNCYRAISDSSLHTYKYNLSGNAKYFFSNAEKYFQSNSDSAIYYYTKTLKEDSTFYLALTYIGQIYDKKKDYNHSKIMYQEAIRKNYIDYMAHWFLADACYATGDLKNALDEIIIAHILNRNNPRIKESLKNILSKSNRTSNDWYFNPQIELTKISDKKISLAFNEKWVGYAMTKALWNYEPGYKESMGVESGKYSTIEDKECLISLLTGLENAKVNIKKDPQLMILKKAAENNFLEEYILFEIVLPQYPNVAYQLQEKNIQRIKNYILDYRYKE